MSAIHPSCGKAIPGGSSGGHCPSCHENFRGEAAYDRHFIRHVENGHTVSLTCRDMAEAVDSSGKPMLYWQDETAYRAWHLGPRLDPSMFERESA